MTRQVQDAGARYLNPNTTADLPLVEHLDLWTSAVRSKSTSGRGSNRKLELAGIKKLRELILELAVRGKLVPQDPNDEPASVLLERIEAEKARLVKEGKIKKPKTLAPISDEEMPFDLPLGWKSVRLGTLTEMYNGRAFKSSEWGETGLPIVRIQNLNDESAPFNFFSGHADERNHIKDGTFLISWSGTPGTSFGAFIWNRGPAVLNQHINKCVFHSSELNMDFIRISVNGKMNEFIARAKGGVGLKHVTKGVLEGAVLMLPPVAEQHRIVAKVDELMALCDQLEQQSEHQLDAHQRLVETLLATLTDAQDADELATHWQRLAEHFDLLFSGPMGEWAIDRLKDTILQLAVMGKLVPQNPDDEPASVLLERIEREKARLVAEGKIKKPKNLPPVSDDEKAFELPAGWTWCRLGNLAVRSEAGWSPKCEDLPRENLEWGVLKVSAVTWGVFKPEENKALPSHLEAKPEYEVLPGDFLISRANTAELVARSVVVPTDTPKYLMMSDKIIRFIFSSLAYPDYINLFNGCSLAREYYLTVAGGTSSSMKNVSQAQIQSLTVPLPPLAEQHRIVAKVDELFALCDQLKAKLQTVSETQRNLTEALVEQALAN